MKQKYWFFLTMLPLVALLNYWTNLTWWQAVLAGAVLNMWAWTLLSMQLVAQGKEGGDSGSVQPGGPNDSSGRDLGQPMAVAADEFEVPDVGVGNAMPGVSLNGPQFNTATGLSMINDTLDVHGNIFGTRSADELLNRN